jgi:hypothetical protein
LGSERLPPVPLFAEVQTSHLGLEAGRSDPKFLICEPPTPRQWLRRAGAYAADFALAAFVPF